MLGTGRGARLTRPAEPHCVAGQPKHPPEGGEMGDNGEGSSDDQSPSASREQTRAGGPLQAGRSGLRRIRVSLWLEFDVFRERIIELALAFSVLANFSFCKTLTQPLRDGRGTKDRWILKVPFSTFSERGCYVICLVL